MKSDYNHSTVENTCLFSVIVTKQTKMFPTKNCVPNRKGIYVLLLLMIGTNNLVDGQGLISGDASLSHCQEITIEMCLNMPYKKTFYPNLMGHASQEQARNEIYQYFPLTKAGCSPDIAVRLNLYRFMTSHPWGYKIKDFVTSEYKYSDID